ncbi:hypothetical protein HPB50_021997 [Hyalomma asiaticum]|uniref:Uncharacterized protein n=1 Tax=Hyalomma asiaticum TaxID=266040 RepID=A0ACB7S8I1_HYAAI|nr:hypothetical protein HPB50_021997 [Hyalomma asiaticum]
MGDTMFVLDDDANDAAQPQVLPTSELGQTKPSQRILLNTEHGDTKVDLFMAVQMLAAAWMSTWREVVKNCFTHAGFRLEEMSLGSSGDDAQAADDVGPAQDTATAAAWEALEEAGIVPANVALSDYVNADADVIVYEELTDAAILKSAPAATADSSDDEEVWHDVPKVPTPVTASQVMDSLAPMTTMSLCNSSQNVSSAFSGCSCVSANSRK